MQLENQSQITSCICMKKHSSVGLLSSEMTLSESVYCVTIVFKMNMQTDSLYFYACSFEENIESFS